MAAKKAAAKAANEQPPFEEGLAELEAIVDQLEHGELPLDKSLELFEKGVKLSDSCRKQLQEAESKVEILLKKEGRVEAEPFTLNDGEPSA
jgi:exodeoxyribonuclease VII small subunit